MRPGIQLVLDLLRQQPAAQPPTEDLVAALDLAAREHVLPVVLQQLRASGLPVPPPAEPVVLAHERDRTLASFWWTAELRGLLAAFAEARIPVIPLKGPFLAQRIYGSAELRSCRDLDLLVPAGQFVPATELLGKLGFHPYSRPDDYHQQWHRSSTAVELHFNVENPLAFSLNLPALWRRATPATFAGQPCTQLLPADEFLYLCLHAVRHRFERLSHSLDLALYLRVHPELHLQAPSAMNPVLAIGLAMVSRFDPSLRVPAQSARIEALADTLWAELLNHTAETLDWQAQHRFYLELEPNAGARFLRQMRHARILATRLIDPDYAFAARFGVQHPAAVWLLRPLRLLLRTPSRGAP